MSLRSLGVSERPLEGNRKKPTDDRGRYISHAALSSGTLVLCRRSTTHDPSDSFKALQRSYRVLRRGICRCDFFLFMDHHRPQRR